MLEVLRLQEQDEAAFGRLVQLYLHESSDHLPCEISAEGLFPADLVVGDGTFPVESYVVKVKDRAVGFSCVRGVHDSETDFDFTIAHIFVAKPYRRIGLGEGMVKKFVREFGGRWRLSAPVGNREAGHFCRAMVARFGEDHLLVRCPSGEWLHYDFNAREKSPANLPGGPQGMLGTT
ncbi:MAG: hypothetical protein KIT11_09030 [Fimbriimonadaceae bacterium]|nr:hypothetical protein [Fimbriimonadaceae bacterium]QYK55471.1 MAG: hypothetical protein KF733_10700 [Fimbriimonadaceae bacterium]